MKEQALYLAGKQTGQSSKFNSLREYVQAYMLRILHDAGLFRSTAFVGGTALRFLHDVPRFSEDLDFSHAKGDAVKFVPLLKKIEAELVLAGYAVAVSYKNEKAVASAFVRFPGLLHEAGLSPHQNQNLSVKIEIDTNPPEGAVLRTAVVNKYFPIAFFAYDLPSLFAGKLNAVLCRRYVKGRDFFDLGWLLSRWPELAPNMELLRNGLLQMHWQGPMPDQDHWRHVISRAVEKADWKKVVQDAQNFLEKPSDMDIFSKENILQLLKRG